jgi:hypothetical protein
MLNPIHLLYFAYACGVLDALQVQNLSGTDLSADARKFRKHSC